MWFTFKLSSHVLKLKQLLRCLFSLLTFFSYMLYESLCLKRNVELWGVTSGNVFPSEVKNRETIAATETINDTYCLQNRTEKFPSAASCRKVAGLCDRTRFIYEFILSTGIIHTLFRLCIFMLSCTASHLRSYPGLPVSKILTTVVIGNKVKSWLGFFEIL